MGKARTIQRGVRGQAPKTLSFAPGASAPHATVSLDTFPPLWTLPSSLIHVGWTEQTDPGYPSRFEYPFLVEAALVLPTPGKSPALSSVLPQDLIPTRTGHRSLSREERSLTPLSPPPSPCLELGSQCPDLCYTIR